MYKYNNLFSGPEDYEAINSSNVTFSPAQTSAYISVTIVDDDVYEDMERFTVEVVATGGHERVDVGDAASISISDNDSEMSVSNPSSCYFDSVFVSLVCLAACHPASLPACCLFVCTYQFVCLPACIVSTQWREEQIIKQGDREDPSNYWGFTLLSVVGKRY